MVIAQRTKVRQDALTRECDGVPIGWHAIKTPTSAIFSNLVECISHSVDLIPYLHVCISPWYASSMVCPRLDEFASARSGCQKICWCIMKWQRTNSKSLSTYYKHFCSRSDVRMLHGHH